MQTLVKGFWCCDDSQTGPLAAVLRIQKWKDISGLDSWGPLIGKEGICYHKRSLVRNTGFKFSIIEPERKERSGWHEMKDNPGRNSRHKSKVSRYRLSPGSSASRSSHLPPTPFSPSRPVSSWNSPESDSHSTFPSTTTTKVGHQHVAVAAATRWSIMSCETNHYNPHAHMPTVSHSVWPGPATENCFTTINSLTCLTCFPFPLSLIFIFVLWSNVCFSKSPSYLLTVCVASHPLRWLLGHRCCKCAIKTIVISCSE